MLVNLSSRAVVAAATLAAGVMCFCPIPAVAAVLTWTLHNVAFDDGGTAEGTFNYDADTNTFSDFNISVSGGDATFFPAFVYSTATSHLRPPLSANDLSIDANAVVIGDERTLFMQFEQPLTNAGGISVVQNPDGLGGDSEFRTLVTSPPFGQRGFNFGGTVSAVPEPSAFTLVAFGAAAVGVLLHRKRKAERRRTPIPMRP
jgi:PEP-CTERM motif